MAYSHEALAQLLAKVPLEVHGAYRTELEPARIYDGHVNRPTTKCAVIVALRGQADFAFDGTERYRLVPGTALLGGMGKRLEIRAGAEGFEYGLVHYLPVATPSDAWSELSGVQALQVPADPELLQLLDRLLEVDTVPYGIGLLEKKSLFYGLLNKLLQPERLREGKETYPIVDEAVRYIRAHHAEPLTLDRLADRYGIKPKYFSSLFRKYMGMGPIDYLIRYRMNRANEMLATGQFPVSAVAKSVGYSDAYYFSRLFKKHRGVAPGKVGTYRKRNRPS